MANASVALRLGVLNRDNPIEMLMLDDFSGIGHWSATTVKKNLPLVKALDDREDPLEFILEWFETAESQGRVIVGF